VDDAHAFGIAGDNGRGSPERFGVENGVHLLMGTLGKAAGGMGAFVAGSREIIDYIRNSARSFIFSTAMPPAVAVGALKAVEIIRGCGDGRKKLKAVTENFHAHMQKLGFKSDFQSYIIPLVTGEAGDALKAAEIFWENGVYLQAIRPPTVPRGSSRLRLTLSLGQREEDRKKVLRLLDEKISFFKTDHGAVRI